MGTGAWGGTRSVSGEGRFGSLPPGGVQLQPSLPAPPALPHGPRGPAASRAQGIPTAPGPSLPARGSSGISRFGGGVGDGRSPSASTPTNPLLWLPPLEFSPWAAAGVAPSPWKSKGRLSARAAVIIPALKPAIDSLPAPTRAGPPRALPGSIPRQSPPASSRRSARCKEGGKREIFQHIGNINVGS